MSETLPETRRSGRLRRPSEPVVALCLLSVSLGAAAFGTVTPARGIVQREFGVDDQLGVWIITLFALAYAAGVPSLGRFADRHGRSRVLLACLGTFAAASVVCGLAHLAGSFALLATARAVQGAAAGGILPIAIAEVAAHSPRSRRHRALGLVGAAFGAGLMLGPALGSIPLTAGASWAWACYATAALGAVALGVAARTLPRREPLPLPPFDARGLFVLVVGVLALLTGFRTIDYFGRGLLGATVWPFLLVAAGCALAFVWVERRAEHPLIEVTALADTRVALALGVGLAGGVLVMTLAFVAPFAENALHLPAGTGGYVALLFGTAAAAAYHYSGRLVRRFGASPVLAAGLACSGAGAASGLLWALPQPGWASVAVSLALCGAGAGVAVGPATTRLLLDQRTPAADHVAGGTALALARALGAILAPAITVGFLAQSGSQLHHRLTAELPRTIEASALPRATEVSQRLAALGADYRASQELKGVSWPDLDDGRVIRLDSGASVPEGASAELKTADVTTIVERTQRATRVLFDAERADRVAEVQDAVDASLAALAKADEKLARDEAESVKAVAQAASNYDEMGGTLARLNRQVARAGRAANAASGSLASLRSASASVDRQIAELTSGMPGIDRSIDQLTGSLASMDAALGRQRAALAALQATPPSPARDAQIAQVSATIAHNQDARNKAVAQLASLRAKKAGAPAALASARAQKASADGQLDAATARATKARAERNALVSQRTDVANERQGLLDTRSDKEAARDAIRKSRGLVGDARTELAALRAGVPTAYDAALTTYLGEVDRRGPALEGAYQATVNDGFRGIFWVDAGASALGLALLGLLAWTCRRRRAGRG